MPMTVGHATLYKRLNYNMVGPRPRQREETQWTRTDRAICSKHIRKAGTDLLDTDLAFPPCKGSRAKPRMARVVDII